MDQSVAKRRGETTAHLELKRAALLWAQAHGYSVCAAEVSLPRCRFRADIAAYRPERNRIGSTAIFECKQARSDLRRDNESTAATRERLTALFRRRQILERCLRVHYPPAALRDSLFAEYETHDLEAIPHRGYARLRREMISLQRRLADCTKFETLTRYHCANLLYLVVPEELFRPAEVPLGWGALVRRNDALALAIEPVWQEVREMSRVAFLERIGVAATRRLDRQWQVTFEDVLELRCRSLP
jgi:hypothetical protein